MPLLSLSNSASEAGALNKTPRPPSSGATRSSTRPAVSTVAGM
jgi:hypothetical protein